MERRCSYCRFLLGGLENLRQLWQVLRLILPVIILGATPKEAHAPGWLSETRRAAGVFRAVSSIRAASTMVGPCRCRALTPQSKIANSAIASSTNAYKYSLEHSSGKPWDKKRDLRFVIMHCRSARDALSNVSLSQNWLLIPSGHSWPVSDRQQVLRVV